MPWYRAKSTLIWTEFFIVLVAIAYYGDLQYPDVQWRGYIELVNISHSLPGVKMYVSDVYISYAVLVLVYIGLILWLGNLLMFLMSLAYGKCCLHQHSNTNSVLGEVQGVSIIKPLMGLDPYLHENLESHFLLNYAKFELFLCVHDDRDPAAMVANQLMAKYPNVDARLVTGGKPGIPNPMVNNMAPAFDEVKYSLIWISTSRIKASTEILTDMVEKIQPSNVALVHQVPYYMDQLGLAGSIDKIYFGTVMPKNYIPFNIVRLCCMTGMSYLIKKEKLDEVGGLPYYGKYLAEDFFMSKALYDKGYRFLLSAIPAKQNVITSSVMSFKDRMVRWNRLRLNMLTFPSVFLEPFVYCFPLGVYAAWCFHYMWLCNPYMFFITHVIVWILFDYILLRLMQNGPIGLSKFEFLSAWFVTNILLLWIYVEAIARPNHIVWGNRTFRVTYGGHTELVKDKSTLDL